MSPSPSSATGTTDESNMSTQASESQVLDRSDAPAGPVATSGTNSALVKTFKDVVAGTTGGIAVTLVGHPFDTLKVRLQTQPADKPIYNGVVDCLKKTLKWEGPTGLYKGVTSPLAGQMLFRATLFGAYGKAKEYLQTKNGGSLSVPDYYKAGAMTGFAAAFTEGPIDFYKSQIQVQIVRSKADPNYKPAYTTVGECVKQTLKNSGIRGPFQGLGATLARNIPANAIYLGSFEVLKMNLAEKLGTTVKDLPAWGILSAGGIGGTLYWLAIFPVDVVKSAMMTDSIVRSERRYSNMLDCASQLYKEGGIKRFYRGFSPCLLRAIPANGVMLFTVDKVGTMLKEM